MDRGSYSGGWKGGEEVILGINMTPLNTTWEQQHQHVCTLCWIVQAHV